MHTDDPDLERRHVPPKAPSAPPFTGDSRSWAAVRERGLTRRELLKRSAVVSAAAAVGARYLGLFGGAQTAWAAQECTADQKYYVDTTSGPCGIGGYQYGQGCHCFRTSGSSDFYCKNGTTFGGPHKSCEDNAKGYEFWLRTNECWSNQYDGWYWEPGRCGCSSGQRRRYSCTDGFTKYQGTTSPTICETTVCV